MLKTVLKTAFSAFRKYCIVVLFVNLRSLGGTNTRCFYPQISFNQASIAKERIACYARVQKRVGAGENLEQASLTTVASRCTLHYSAPTPPVHTSLPTCLPRFQTSNGVWVVLKFRRRVFQMITDCGYPLLSMQ